VSELNGDRIREFYADVLGEGRVGRLEALVAPSYVPHVPVFAARTAFDPGIEALRSRLAAFGRVSHRLARVIVDGEVAFAHVVYGDAKVVAGVDVFRLDAAGRICEHWNVRQPLKGDAADCAAHFSDDLPGDADFPFDPTWLKTRVSTMLKELWGKGRAELVPEFYAQSYIQHNRDMPGGFQRIQQVVRHDIRRYIERTGSGFPIEVHHMAAEGDLACVHLSLFMAGINRNDGARSTNVDIFRLDRQGRMTEHWDVLQIEGIALSASASLF
jgi:predicted SnoaL-like aldol condensation-catalyzing enzyme